MDTFSSYNEKHIFWEFMLTTRHLHLKTGFYHAAIELVRDHRLCTYLAYRDRNKTLWSLLGFPHRVSHIWTHIWRVKHKHCTKEEKLLFFFCTEFIQTCLYTSVCIVDEYSFFHGNPIRCFCDEQHSFNKCTLPCRGTCQEQQHAWNRNVV